MSPELSASNSCARNCALRRLVAIDPGLDGCGVAVFDQPPRSPVAVDAKLALLRHATVIRTTSDERLPARCAFLWSEVRHLCLEWDVSIALVETPTIPGIYEERAGRARHAGRMNARSMAGFHAACGAIYAGLAAAHVAVRETPASRASKRVKRAVVDGWLTQGGRARAPNQDVADALYLACITAWAA